MSILKISIITVVYNDRYGLEKTLSSANKQTYKNFEKIIVDGGSCDGSIDICSEYIRSDDKVISEKDNGIYDAMNKGILLSSGDFIIFMNAGDVFFNNNVLSDFILNYENENENENEVIYYGDAMVDSVKIKKITPRKYFWKGICYCHQSVFFPRKACINFPYDENLRVASDYKQLIQLINAGYLLKKIPVIVSNITSGGVSDTKRLKSIIERINILKKCGLWRCRYNFYYSFDILYNLTSVIINKILH